MARLMPFIKQQFLDANGEPLAGGKVYTYMAGTSTPLATYTDKNAGSSNTNPIILDANGEADIWVGDAFYKFVITDATDAPIKTIDYVSVANDVTAEATLAKEAAELAQANAEIAKQAAETAESNAEAAEALAESWATKTDGIVDSTDYSSKAWAVGGTDVTDTASRGAAKEWATKTGGTVDGTEYSAKHYAGLAAQSAYDANTDAGYASGHAINASNDAIAAGTAQGFAEAAQLAAESARDQAIIGVAKFQTFADDAAYVSAKGSAAADGDAFYDTTDDVVKVYQDGVWKEIGSGGGGNMLTGPSIQGLKISCISGTQNHVIFDHVVLEDTSGNRIQFGYHLITSTLSGSPNGAGRLDTGSVANNTWYYIYIISNGTDVDVLYSTSLTGTQGKTDEPVMPSGYTYRKVVGAVRTNGSGNFPETLQVGNTVMYAAIQTATENTTNDGVNQNIDCQASIPPYIAWEIKVFSMLTANYSVGTSANLIIRAGSVFGGTSTPPIVAAGIYNASSSVAARVSVVDWYHVFNESPSECRYRVQYTSTATNRTSYEYGGYVEGYRLNCV